MDLRFPLSRDNSFGHDGRRQSDENDYAIGQHHGVAQYFHHDSYIHGLFEGHPFCTDRHTVRAGQIHHHRRIRVRP